MKGFSKQKGVGIRKLYSGGHEGRRAGWVLRDSFPQDGGAGGLSGKYLTRANQVILDWLKVMLLEESKL